MTMYGAFGWYPQRMTQSALDDRIEVMVCERPDPNKEIKVLEKTKPVLANLTKSVDANKAAADKFLLASQLRKKPDPNPKKINMPEIMARPFR